MKIRFEGDSHQIDANTLINYLIHYQAVVEEANRIVGEGNKKVTVRINAVSKGSFVVDVELVESRQEGRLLPEQAVREDRQDRDQVKGDAI